ncbi:hypothetical protein ACQKIC_16350 [Peribacillus sp. NPDC046944]|uniref:hypothetical protein n=1 Tax=unclassified Peribacillus TaxID=2675266 RepID=UPI003CFC2716
MSKNLREILLNYRHRNILGVEVHVMGEKKGKVVFDGNYKIYSTIETNYSRLTIDWPITGVLPGEYQEHYTEGSNKYPVDIKYFEEEDKVHLSGKYSGDSYKIVVHLPEKSSY